jgi:hypothetical protein
VILSFIAFVVLAFVALLAGAAAMLFVVGSLYADRSRSAARWARIAIFLLIVTALFAWSAGGVGVALVQAIWALAG